MRRRRSEEAVTARRRCDVAATTPRRRCDDAATTPRRRRDDASTTLRRRRDDAATPPRRRRDDHAMMTRRRRAPPVARLQRRAAVGEGVARRPEPERADAGVHEVLEQDVLRVFGADRAGAEHREARLHEEDEDAYAVSRRYATVRVPAAATPRGLRAGSRVARSVARSSRRAAAAAAPPGRCPGMPGRRRDGAAAATRPNFSDRVLPAAYRAVPTAARAARRNKGSIARSRLVEEARRGPAPTKNRRVASPEHKGPHLGLLLGGKRRHDDALA